ncbi:hypothetical protein SynA1562_00744 [Synechococcus sp. A15-62]|uniref:hypothetical protein n=1 Tax=Synechococcus sp. A15-62 TaxID=1050657 RepID=UPI0016457B52|nr:hypothetical protein [Synechococcus sp. A15-62]QNI99584.1 hypothetical protein SynA1562_00744 [Synechococcus sp. A15-62]
MIRPRWQALKPQHGLLSWRRWDQAIAVIAAVNLTWVAIDLTYIPLRNFWLQRNLYPVPSLPLVVPLPWLPDITPWLDPLKGIEPHRDTEAYLKAYSALDRALQQNGSSPAESTALLKQQAVLTTALMDSNPFISSGQAGTLEKFKNRLRARTGLESARESAKLLLSPKHLERSPWSQERQFWSQQILPLVESNYWRSIDENGRPSDLSWRIDTPFQLLFLLDILLRAWRLKQRYPAIRWRDALLRRWIDLPLLLPFARWLRLIPVTERLCGAGLLQLEPLRAVISRGVVALLAVELFEVIAIRVVDALQQLIRSPQLPERVRGLCSYQSSDLNDEREVIELLRLWLPLLLTRIGPAMRPQLQAVISHLVQQSLDRNVVPDALRRLPGLQNAESEFSRQLAESMVTSVLDLSKGAGNRIGQRDPVLESLGSEALDRLWEELAHTLEQGPVLSRSQDLLVALLEEIKRSSFRQIRDQGDVNALISELDGLNFSPGVPISKDQA